MPQTPTALEGKVALVMGASRGIGAEIARAYAAAGAGVVLAARDEQALLRVADEIEGAGGHAIAVRADVCSEEDVRAAVHVAVDEFGRLDIATNNAAGGAPPTPLADLQLADFEQSIRTNLVGGFLALKHEIAAMLENDGSTRGAIVNISSTAGLQPLPGNGTYSASKAFVLYHSEVLHTEARGSGVTVTAVCPGPVRTEFQETSEARFQTALPSFVWCGPERVAEDALRAAERGKRTVVPGGLPVRLFFGPNRMAPPGLALAVARRVMSRDLRRD